MPVRSLTSSVFKWPERSSVEKALRRWAQSLAREREEIVRIGAFGSFARGEWGFGSDLDLLIIVRDSDRPFISRASGFDATSLPVPADVLVYTQAEWDAMRREGRRFAQTVTREADWLFPSGG